MSVTGLVVGVSEMLSVCVSLFGVGMTLSKIAASLGVAKAFNCFPRLRIVSWHSASFSEAVVISHSCKIVEQNLKFSGRIYFYGCFVREKDCWGRAYVRSGQYRTIVEIRNS